MIARAVGGVLALALMAWLLIAGLTLVGAGKVIDHDPGRVLVITRPDQTTGRARVTRDTFAACKRGAYYLPLLQGRALCWAPPQKG